MWFGQLDFVAKIPWQYQELSSQTSQTCASEIDHDCDLEGNSEINQGAYPLWQRRYVFL